MQENNQSLETLSQQWVEAKQAEKAAQKARLLVEEEIIKLVGHKEEGSKTHSVGTYKVTITGKLNYKADLTQLDRLLSNIPLEFHPIKQERKLDEKGVKYLRDNEPAIFSQLAPAITITPAKTAVDIKLEL